MRLKRGVTQEGTRPEIWYALGVAEAVYKQHGHTLTVTSLTDSHAHRPKSLHNKGLAADLRIRAMPSSTVGVIVRDLHRVLDVQGFDVVGEPDHIHVEFDPKEGQQWLEEVA